MTLRSLVKEDDGLWTATKSIIVEKSSINPATEIKESEKKKMIQDVDTIFAIKDVFWIEWQPK